MPRILVFHVVMLALGLPVVAQETASQPAAEASQPVLSPTLDWEEVTLFGATKDSIGLAAEGFWRQFTYKSTLATLTSGAGATWLADHYDDKWLGALRGNDFLTSSFISALGDETSIALGFSPLVTYLLSRWLEDEKLCHFSVETFGAMLLTWVETIGLSQIDYNVRPRDEGEDPATSFFDTAFRGKSSWPSGHLVAPFTLTFKVWDYYGWKAAILPAGLTVISAGNRIADGSHYPSDIVAAGFLAFSAHLATKKIKTRLDGFHFGAAPLRQGVMLTTGWKF